MKKQRIIKLVSAVLALTLLSSCMIQGVNFNTQQNENSSIVSSYSSSELDNDQDAWVLKKASIPQDNPPPVMVDRKDTNIPIPISYTDKIIDNKIDFDSNPKIIWGSFGETFSEWLSHIAIVDSYEQLKELWQKDQGEYYEEKKSDWEKRGDQVNFDEEDYYVNWYDEKFFEDNTIIMLCLRRGSRKYKIESVGVQNGRMYIYVNNEDSDSGRAPAVTYSSRAFIAVPKRIFNGSSAQDSEKVKDIVVYRDDY